MSIAPSSQSHDNPDDGPASDNLADFEAFDDNPSDTSDLMELTPDEYPLYFEQRDGRLFPSSSSHVINPYPLPVDTPEQQRSVVQHNVLLEVMGALYVGPVHDILMPSTGRQKLVVDMCTGNGKWVLQMAREFEHVQFHGLDIVPIATRYPPEKVFFEMHNISERTRWNDATIDFVHARDAALAVCDFPKLLQEITRILRPGGLFLFGEWGRYVAFDSSFTGDLHTAVPGIVRFWNVINAHLQARGILNVAAGIPAWLQESGQYNSITPQQFCVPLGSWHHDPQTQHRGRAMRSSLAKYAKSLMPMLKMEGWTQNDLDGLLKGLTDDLRNVDGLVSVFHTVHATKV